MINSRVQHIHTQKDQPQMSTTPKMALLKAEAVQRVKQGEFKADLAREFGVAVGTLYEWTKGVPQLGKKPSLNPRYYSSEFRERVIQLITQGAQRKVVAKESGVSIGTISVWTTKAGLEKTNERHSENVRKDAINRVQGGGSKQQVARELKVARSVVMRWTKGIGKTRPSYLEQTRNAAVTRVSDGEQKATVARELGVSIATLHSWAGDIKRKKTVPNATKEEAIRRAENGALKQDIARDLGISKSTVGILTKHINRHEVKQAARDRFIERVKLGESPIPLARSMGIGAQNYHRWRQQGQLDVAVSSNLKASIFEDFKEGKSIYRIALDRQVPVHQLRQLKRVAEGKSSRMPNRSTYTDEMKLKAVREIAAGKSAKSVAKNLEASYASVKNWAKEAAANGELTLSVPTSRSDDLDFVWISQKYPDLEDWRKPLAAWLVGEATGIGHKQSSVNNFVTRYLALPTVPKLMGDLLRRGSILPSLYDELLKVMSPSSAVKQYSTIRGTVDWILLNYFSERDDNGEEPIIAPGFRNPFPNVNRRGIPQNVRDESVRDVMPYGYIVELREKLAPGATFGDWKLAQKAIGFETLSGSTNAQTDWFEVTEDRIDKADPNCVWRVRERISKPPILEMWSPVRWVAVLVKLQTVARTGMIRMLDSGESDTWRYEANSFKLNSRDLASLNRGNPWQQGVFRCNPVDDPSQRAILYFNTNKTKDKYRSGPDKGHECPWPMFECVSDNPYYWLELLRNWQEKYNPIVSRTSWKAIPASRSIGPKSQIAKAAYPETCFLFRTPEEKGKEHFPVSNAAVDKAWRNLLRAFDEELAEKQVTHPDGSPVRLLQVTEGRTKFPLHGLRVSLITSMVIDGRIPPELMMKIVGHSRLVMLLYYTKPGLTRLRDALKEAAKGLDANKEATIIRFLTDSTEEEMLDRIVFNSEDWRTVIPVNPAHRNAAGWLLMHDGICFAGGNSSQLDDDARIPGCHNGGPLRKASTNEYDPVPGGVMNCSRCRWKAAEKTHGPALVATFNNQAYHLRQAQEKALKYSREITNIKKEKARVETTGAIFANMSGLKTAERHYETAMVKMSDIAASMAETHKMIMRVKELPDISGGGMALAIAGDLMTMQTVLEETDSELLQLSGVCGDVELHPDLSPGTAIYRRSQIYDAALKREKMPPFFMQLTEDDQLRYGNAFMSKLAEMANFENPLLGLRTVISTIEAGESIEQLLGVKLPDLLPRALSELAVGFKLPKPKESRDEKNRRAS